MASFRCSCGENLVAPSQGILRCWFCSLEYAFPEGVPLVVQYEEQKAWPVVKTLDVHAMTSVKKKKVCPFDI